VKVAHSVHHDPAATRGAEEWVLRDLVLEWHLRELEPCRERSHPIELASTGYAAWGSDVGGPLLAGEGPTTASGCLRHLHNHFARLEAIGHVWRDQLRASWQPLQTFSESIRGPARLLGVVVGKYMQGPAFEDAASREIRETLEQGQLQDARALAMWASASRPDSEPLARWAALLKPARARVAGPASGRRRRAEATWLRQHASGYAGQWVALDGDRLIAAGASLSEIRRKLRETGCAEQALLHFVPSEPRG